MAHPLPETTIQEKNRLATTGAWLWLFEIFAGDETLVVRVVNNPTPIEFDVDEDGLPERFEPRGVFFELLQEGSDGALASVRATISNVDLQIGALLERYDGLCDQLVRVHLVNTEHLDDPDAKISCDYRVEQSTMTDEVVAFDLSAHPFLEIDFPYRKYSRVTCPFLFGSEECGWGFVPGEGGPIAPPGVTESFSCSRLLNGPNGCRAHGALYEAAGLEPIHPKRFGGQPLIPIRKSA